MTCLEDLASDFSVFHRISNIRRLRSVTFLRMAERLGIYNGAFGAYLRQRAKGAATPGKKAAAMPVATAAELRSQLAQVPGAGLWGTVSEVKTGPQEGQPA
jgi:hypothetical protein